MSRLFIPDADSAPQIRSKQVAIFRLIEMAGLPHRVGIKSDVLSI
jgi:hypothetical protein